MAMLVSSTLRRPDSRASTAFGDHRAATPTAQINEKCYTPSIWPSSPPQPLVCRTGAARQGDFCSPWDDGTVRYTSGLTNHAVMTTTTNSYRNLSQEKSILRQQLWLGSPGIPHGIMGQCISPSLAVLPRYGRGCAERVAGSQPHN
ncbi:hypothetical protein BC835DRAFT_1063248 [Cytidiella melzeri]|nr:hypothetical protein BC835DRAFT_1063248 [Cytidiella melzeri]